MSPRSGRSQMHSNADEWSVRTRDEHNAFAQISCTTRFLWRSHWSFSFVQQSVCHCEFFLISVPVMSRNGGAFSYTKEFLSMSRTVGHEAWICVAWDMFRDEFFFSVSGRKVFSSEDWCA